MFLGMSSLCSSSFGGTGAPVAVVEIPLDLVLEEDDLGVAPGGTLTVAVAVTTGGKTGGFEPNPPLRQSQSSRPSSRSKSKTINVFRSLRFIFRIRIVYPATSNL